MKALADTSGQMMIGGRCVSSFLCMLGKAGVV
jgi:hypothetical protein